MSAAALWTWLESLPIAVEIGSTWWFPLLESIHVVTVTFVVGSILMVDLRLLGLAARGHPSARIIGEVLPWTWGAFALSAATGAGLFITQATRYAGNPAFQVKVVLLVLAGVNMAVFHTRRAAGGASEGKLTGACSLVLWVAIILAGRWIGHLS